MATTPTPDRMDDIIEPLGVTFAASMPLLLFHDATMPVGKVMFGRPTKDGIPFDAVIPEVTEAGDVKNLTDRAAHFVKYGLIGAVSIGFRILNNAFKVLKTGGRHFLETEVVETSLVVIPANHQAVIAVIKSIDAQHSAASGRGAEAVARPSAGVSAQVARGTQKGVRPMPKSIHDQIESYNAQRQAKSASMTAIMEQAATDGVTLDQAQSDTYDTLETEVKALDAHLSRLDTMQKAQTIRPVVATTPAEAAASRMGQPVISVKSNLPPGIELIRTLICREVAHRSGGITNPLEVAKQRYPDSPRVHEFIRKAAVPAGTTTDPVFVGPLVSDTLSSEFLEYLRPATIIGKFGLNGIPSLLSVAFNSRIDGQTSGGTAYWVGQGAPKPLTSVAFNSQTFLFYKAAAISVLSEEAIRYSSPSAEVRVRDALVKAVTERLDIDFIDPTVSAVTGINPASITNGLTPLSSAGTSADNARTDIQNVLAAFLSNNQDPSGLVLIMSTALGLALSIQVNTLGQPEFPGISMSGGKLLGIPVIMSNYAANQSGAGNMVIAVNAPFVGLADDGQVSVDISREASVQMSDAPTNNAATGTGASLVSLWQTNSVGIRAERAINWAVLRTGAVVYMDDVNWGSIGSP